jgi:hypothetical protein
MYTRRGWFQAAIPLGAMLLIARRVEGRTAGKPEIRMYRKHDTPCCDQWASHLKENGFAVRKVTRNDLAAVKADYKIPPQLISCHTAVCQGYIIEGHVPADLIHQLLRERPIVAGIAVAGMPAGAPGNEATGQKQLYDVVLFYHDGKITTYAKR